MAKYVFIYHGGSRPDTEEKIAEVMGQWQSWLAGIGEDLVDGGSPVGMSSTVHSDGSVTDDGGCNPVSGYTFINANSKQAAIDVAKSCPILNGGGSVEVIETLEM